MPFSSSQNDPNVHIHRLIVRWHERQPPPLRVLKHSAARGGLATAAPPWLETGDVNRPFDFGGYLRRLMDDVVVRCGALSHVQVPRILVAATLSRNGRSHGLQARVTPLRFRDGMLTRKRHGVTYQVQRFFQDENEFFYVMSFYLPRFLNQSFDDKFITVFHELFHISPRCDGDLRRHGGRYDLHSHSQKHYDRHMADLARAYLDQKPNPDLFAFLRLNFAQLCHRHGGIQAIFVPRPQVFPVAWPGSPALQQAATSTPLSQAQPE